MNRRRFLTTVGALAAGCCLSPYARALAHVKSKRKMLILGFDGMDCRLTTTYLQKGVMPNLKKVIDAGSFMPMATSTPPQSPVAWSNVTVGGPPALHGVYDFIHRDPSSRTPYLSTSEVLPPSMAVKIGEYDIPLKQGGTKILRQGKPFWEYLTERDLPATIFRMPANFPCKGGGPDMVSGMGTPDLRGGYGNFTVFTSDPGRYRRDMTGGRVIPVEIREDRIDTVLPGPSDTFRRDKQESRIPVAIWRDKVHSVIRLRIAEKEFLFQQGEWSEWIPVSFPLLGGFHDVKGIVKLYVKSVHPHVDLYVSPINIDPADPSLPVVSSSKYGRELAENVGYFHTEGFPENTKALSEGVLSDAEYLVHAKSVLQESRSLLDYELGRFSRWDEGMLFFYFSSLDQNTHMFWRTLDPGSPLYDLDIAREFGHTMPSLYAEADKVIGSVLEKYDIRDPDFSLVVMSDHGFAPFNRQFNVNTFLYEKGYLGLKNPGRMEDEGYFRHVDWSRTGAYNVGINSVYLNMEGREEGGVVTQNQRDALLNDLAGELSGFVDPGTGKRPVAAVRIVPVQEQRMNPHAPDMIIGWNPGYRTSWKSILGGFESNTVENNLDKWTGDHCIDSRFVPAALISNKKVLKPSPDLCDIAPTILDFFGIPAGGVMTGKSLLQMG